jgi:hypothetical protein
VTALDLDSGLLDALAERAGELPVRTVVADAREFDLESRFPLCIVPMQTIQLLGGADGRASFLRCARLHLRDGGTLAIAITGTLELFDVADGARLPLPDISQVDGVVYSSQPTAVRPERDGFVLERRRERITPDGSRVLEDDRIHLDRLSAEELAREGASAGLDATGTTSVPPTDDHVGSEVVMFRA